jgi:hypothetical protein
MSERPFTPPANELTLSSVVMKTMTDKTGEDYDAQIAQVRKRLQVLIAPRAGSHWKL